MTASEVRRQLIAQYGYTEEELPTSETIRRKLNDLGYTLMRVLKTKPIKKIPETEAIFEQFPMVFLSLSTMSYFYFSLLPN